MSIEPPCCYDQYYTKLCKPLGINITKGKPVAVATPAWAPIKVTDEIKDTDHES